MMVMMMVFNEFRFALLSPAAAFDLEHRFELVGLGQFVGGFQIISALFEFENLPPRTVANCFQRYLLLRQRFHGVAMLVKEVEPKTRRHVCLEDAEFHACRFGLDE